jgi:ABC-type polysaccharide/polyol phosphate transport system ATPase subunit
MNSPIVSDPLNSDEAIRLDNVSVCYRAPQERIGTFKEYAIRWLQGKVQHQSFLALNEASLTVRRGEVFGLVGRNGAGKSTLLKLVARVLRPTQGRVRVMGRVAPLLELGAGFHPELTGRENIYLNGAMLGFTRREMDEKFPRIVEFAELGDFIEAPIRTYSSGMWARLGFAVATDSCPEILIVDEILSVGDESFQQKSADRIQSFREQGATVLLVSHNMSAIETMCQRAAWLDHGKVMLVGSAKEVVDRYVGRVYENETGRLIRTSVPDDRRWGSRKIEITRVSLTDAQGAEQVVFSTGQTMVLRLDYTAHTPVQSPIFGIGIHRQDGVHVTGPNTGFAGLDVGLVEGSGTLTYTISSLPLLDGLYHFSVAATNQKDTEMFDYHDRAYPFRVVNHGQEPRERYGLLTLNGVWQVS